MVTLGNWRKLAIVFAAIIITLVIFATAALAWPQKFAEVKDNTKQTKVSLVCPSADSYKNGDIIEVGLIFDIPEKSHIYGRDGGQTGLPTTIKWQLPKNVKKISTIWPAPKRLKYLDEYIFGYEGQIAIIGRFQILSQLTEVTQIGAEVSWLDCSESGCHPGQAKLPLKLISKNDKEQSEQYQRLVQQTISNQYSELKAQNAASLWAAEPNAKTSSSFEETAIKKWQITAFYILCAFLGGILLNFMPCVFPVLSLKVFSLIEQAQKGKQQGRSLQAAVWFSLGIILSFWAVYALMIALRMGGQKLGWGFQMQYPPFVAFLTVLFFLIALNLWGVFEFGLGFTRLGNLEKNEPKASSAVFSGVITVIAATPCTAPFMGSALGFSLSAPLYVSGAIFTALAIGMALPYALLVSWPTFLKFLPRPGRWMETFKQFLAFPLAFTCIYFVWVFAQQTGINGAAFLLAALVWLALAAWTYGRFVQKSPRIAYLFTILLSIASILNIYWACITSYDIDASAVTTQKSIEASVWSPQAVQEALEQGSPVFIDFGAAWCLTCQINEKTVLASSEIKQLFKKKGVVFFKADWTNHSDEITEALRNYGRTGVPLYVYYDPKKPNNPLLLPEILTVNIVKSHLE